MRLSEAIRLGSQTTRQAHGALYRHRRKYFFGLIGPLELEACALGAAFNAINCPTEITKVNESSRTFRGMAAAGEETLTFQPPDEWQTIGMTTVACPQCGHTEILYRVVPHLNDTHRWTREEIALFVERIEAQAAPINEEGTGPSLAGSPSIQEEAV